MNAITNFEIESLLKHIKSFKGCFCKNQLKGIKPFKNGSMIINLDDVEGDGTHWSVIIVEDGIATYIDSFAQPPPKDVLKFLSRISNKGYFNVNCIQKLNSSKCGYYCMYFILEKERGYNIEDIMNRFKDYNYNEKLIKNYFKL